MNPGLSDKKRRIKATLSQRSVGGSSILTVPAVFVYLLTASTTSPMEVSIRSIVFISVYAFVSCIHFINLVEISPSVICLDAIEKAFSLIFARSPRGSI